MQKVLPGGLILRSLSEQHQSDYESLAAFYGGILGDDEQENAQIAVWTQDLVSGSHPTVTPEDIWVVVDPAEGDRIVSATLLIPQVWRYEDVELPAGRPELVATDPNYRRRGLVRALMDTAHERSAALGHIVQGITGIQHYYRQFGYAMTVDLGSDSTVALSHVPARPAGQNPAYTLRSATDADIPKLLAWDAYRAQSCLLSVKRDAAYWRYELNGRTAGSMVANDCQIILNGAGEPVGYLLVKRQLQQRLLICPAWVIGEEASYVETYQDVLLALRDYARRFDPVPEVVGFDSGIHPALKTLIQRTLTGNVQPRKYTWYLRVPEMAAFLRHIAPVLERRLEGSGAHCYSGELKISFYSQTGVRLVFERGRLTTVESVTGLYEQSADAGFPWHTFLNVVFGHRNYESLSPILPDVYCSGKAHVLLDALFPLKQSWLLGLT